MDTKPTFTLRVLRPDMTVRTITGFPHYQPCRELAQWMPSDGISGGVVAAQVWNGDAMLCQFLAPEIEGIIEDFFMLEAALRTN